MNLIIHHINLQKHEANLCNRLYLSPIFYLYSNKYRFAFNGKENDNEVKGDGNQQDYGMRIYDPRIGRFLSMDVDSLLRKYCYYSPYQFSGNKPIWAVDLDGREELFVTNYLNSNRQLYKTVITVVGNTPGNNNTLIAHVSQVQINANGNATVSYMGSITGDFSNPSDLMYSIVPALRTINTLESNGKLRAQVNTNKIYDANNKSAKSVTTTNATLTPSPNNVVDLPENVNAVPVNPSNRFDMVTNTFKSIGTWGSSNAYQSSAAIPAMGGAGTFTNQPTQQQAINANKSGCSPTSKTGGTNTLIIQ